MSWKHNVPAAFLAGMTVLGSMVVMVVTVLCLWRMLRQSSFGTGSETGARPGRNAESSALDLETGTVSSARPSAYCSSSSSIVQNLPLLRFSKSGGVLATLVLDFTGPMNECPVCLNEYQEGDIVRFLPNCKHIFHPDCIKSWIDESARHPSTCPLCRTNVQVNKMSQMGRMLALIHSSNQMHGGARQKDLWKAAASVDSPTPGTLSDPEQENAGSLGPANIDNFLLELGSDLPELGGDTGNADLDFSRSPPTDLGPGIFAAVWGSYLHQNTAPAWNSISDYRVMI